MERNDLRIISKSLEHVRDLIGIVARPDSKFEYDSFEDDELRDMYYKINSMCISVEEKIKKLGGN
jgi:hypothetical protein